MISSTTSLLSCLISALIHTAAIVLTNPNNPLDLSCPRTNEVTFTLAAGKMNLTSEDILGGKYMCI
jgi:hypothetical protein